MEKLITSKSVSLNHSLPRSHLFKFSNSLYCLPHNSCDASSENLKLDQLIIS